MKTEFIRTDLLIIGGGTAGCWAAITAAQTGRRILICEKAHIKRSGCLAAGVNALNAYITKGKTPQDYADYCKQDAAGIARDDLLLSLAERFNSVTARLEELGLVILKDADGNYVSRGWRNIKINGENIKPLLAEAVSRYDNITVRNHVNITDLAVSGNRVQGAYGIGIRDDTFYCIEAPAVLIATGGAAGLYRPNNPGFSRHKMWYPPFNTGAGYAMGIRHGAEMTTMEMRFIALRCKDTIAPTGTLAQGVGARQINAAGEVYEQKYGLTTSERVYGTVRENLEGRGPCYLRTEGISPEQDDALIKAYLNMAPSQTLRWIEQGKLPSQQNVEIEGTEPYIVGGHTASGFWVDASRATTIGGLYAAGDVAGGAPQKYVTGALAEGEIAAESISRYLDTAPAAALDPDDLDAHRQEIERYLAPAEPENPDTAETLEAAMQQVMDTCAGGIGTHYQYSAAQLAKADAEIRLLEQRTERLHAADFYALMQIYELRERLTVCRCVIAHLNARKETRWHCFAERTDFPLRDDRDFRCFVNSRLEGGEFRIILRDLRARGGECNEHPD
ncbi:MAG: adenylyl-sulfate reductase subunit alpha [Oscillospiraceae bacterium]|nr:adenylyl-sulfate reductase subunit alpha [Oscillospiraceae bacterium]